MASLGKVRIANVGRDSFSGDDTMGKARESAWRVKEQEEEEPLPQRPAGGARARLAAASGHVTMVLTSRFTVRCPGRRQPLPWGWSLGGNGN